MSSVQTVEELGNSTSLCTAFRSGCFGSLDLELLYWIQMLDLTLQARSTGNLLDWIRCICAGSGAARSRSRATTTVAVCAAAILDLDLEQLRLLDPVDYDSGSGYRATILDLLLTVLDLPIVAILDSTAIRSGIAVRMTAAALDPAMLGCRLQLLDSAFVVVLDLAVNYSFWIWLLLLQFQIRPSGGSFWIQLCRLHLLKDVENASTKRK